MVYEPYHTGIVMRPLLGSGLFCWIDHRSNWALVTRVVIVVLGGFCRVVLLHPLQDPSSLDICCSGGEARPLTVISTMRLRFRAILTVKRRGS